MKLCKGAPIGWDTNNPTRRPSPSIVQFTPSLSEWLNGPRQTRWTGDLTGSPH
ncbi:hypothetical protein [Azospirillum melinis]